MPNLLDSLGLVVYPLLVCSVASLTIIIERLYYFMKTPKEFSDKLMNQIKLKLKADQVKAAIRLCSRKKGPIAKVIKAGISNSKAEVGVIKDKMEEIELKEFPKLERRLGLLYFIGRISPSLGLLGTVAGMIKTFYILSLDGAAQQLAGGISEALLTTAIGLIISLPTLGAYRYFIGSLEKIVKNSDQRQLELITYLKQLGRG